MCQKRVMHIWLELYMWQKRYRQFKDTNWNRTCRKRGSNQKVPPYMSQNVSPFRPMNPLAMANYQIELTLLSLALSYHTSFEWRFLRTPPLGPLSSKHTWTFYDWFHSLAMQNQANQLSNSHIHLIASVKRTVDNRFYIAK